MFISRRQKKKKKNVGDHTTTTLQIYRDSRCRCERSKLQSHLWTEEWTRYDLFFRPLTSLEGSRSLKCDIFAYLSNHRGFKLIKVKKKKYLIKKTELLIGNFVRKIIFHCLFFKNLIAVCTVLCVNWLYIALVVSASVEFAIVSLTAHSAWKRREVDTFGSLVTLPLTVEIFEIQNANALLHLWPIWPIWPFQISSKFYQFYLLAILTHCTFVELIILKNA